MSVPAVDPGTSPRGPRRIDGRLDHLVLATPRLEQSVREFATRSGVAPVPGGRHLGVGTRNYLVGLGPGRYLEILGPDVAHPPDSSAPMPFGIDQLERPKLAAWSIRSSDLRAATRAALSAGADLGPIRYMSRRGHDGTALEWQVAYPLRPPLDGLVPFVIDWGISPHPSMGDLPTVELVELRGSHPEPAKVLRVLEALEVTLTLTTGPARLEVDLRTPYGTLTLS
ncbi:VOC family protein [Nakamurella leprariae]|uniref:VOC family protein n=1 Tax=Nakamurella leprariae TaxID=2803911 RepID=A0A939C205_9ACTN|nr:VOC family protein [Nakamurella leprariae]MBM9467652.1 VOC family protein [Nakamurella leprariae]